MKIDIHYETVDAIVVAALRESYESFKKDLKAHKDGSMQLKMFNPDPEEDYKQIKKHFKACKLMLEWYGGAIE